MSIISKTAGSCKKCKRKCEEQQTKGIRGTRNTSNYNMGPLYWLPHIVGGELMSDELLLDTEPLIGDINELISFMKLGCLSKVGEDETEEIKSEMFKTLNKKLNTLIENGGLTAPPAGQCTYIGVSNLKINVETKNCENKGSEIEAETTFDLETDNRPCPE